MGTWRAEYEYGQHMVHDEDGRLVMATHDRRVALLVAAAPKLLAACEALKAWNDQDPAVPEHLWVSLERSIDLALSAIREAKGGDE